MLPRGYFTVFTWEKAFFYVVALAFVGLTTVAVILQPFMDLECPETLESDNRNNLQYENVLYVPGPCPTFRHLALFFLTVEECVFARRILAAVILGGVSTLAAVQIQ
jgi:hypothetical protein